MANVVGNILTGKPLVTGGVLIGDFGATLPTTAVAAPAVGFVSAGYIGEDGLTETVGRTTEKVKAWGGDIVKVLQTEFSVTYQFSFMESLNTTVLESVYGDDNVTVTAPTVSTGTLRTVLLNSTQLPHKAMIFEVKDGDAKVRITAADAQITEVGDVTYNDGSVIVYPVTVECFKDSAGNNAYKYLDDGVFSA